MDPREDQRRWLVLLLEQTGLSATALAMRAGLAPTTVTRFLNSAEHYSALSSRTVAALEAATRAYLQEKARGDGFREEESAPYISERQDDLIDKLIAQIAAIPGLDTWIVRSHALKDHGYWLGDLLILDENVFPARGDVVRAQIYDWRTGRAETDLWIWEPPALTAPGGGAREDAQNEAPERARQSIDDHNVVLKGVVVAMVRRHRRTGASESYGLEP